MVHTRNLAINKARAEGPTTVLAMQPSRGQKVRTSASMLTDDRTADPFRGVIQLCLSGPSGPCTERLGENSLFSLSTLCIGSNSDGRYTCNCKNDNTEWYCDS